MKNVLINALRASGNLQLGYFDKQLKVKYKESQSSILTEADIESDKVIIGIIRDSYPEHNIISEESGLIYNNSEFTWIVDPLDGTSNFASGIPWFGVIIALLKNNMPFMGGAYLPVHDMLYFAEKGMGAFRNGDLLPMLDKKDLKDSLFGFGLDYSDNNEYLNKGVEIYKNIVKTSRNTRSTNSIIDFLYVAEGKFGGVINLNTKIWDIAGPEIIISEVGGVLKNIGGGDIQYSVDEKVIDETYPVIAGSDHIVRFLNDIIS